MSDAWPSLSDAERVRRWSLVQDLMAARELDALIVYGEREGVGQPIFAPDTWLTNDRPGNTVVAVRGDDPYVLVNLHTAVGEHIDARRRGDALWIPPERMYAGPGASEPGAGRSARAIAALLRELELDRGRVGVVGIDPFGASLPDGVVPFGTIAGLERSCPGLTLIPAWHPWRAMTLARSDEELALVERCALAGEAMATAMVDRARVGAGEHELYGAAMAACAELGAISHHMILVVAPGGESVGWGPPPWTYRAQPPSTLREGDVVLAELFPTYAMLETQQQLAIAVGDVHEDVLRAGDAARRSYEAALATLRPGTRFGAVLDAMRAPIEAVDGWCLTPPIHTVNPHALLGPCLLSPTVAEASEYASLGGVVARGEDVDVQPGMCFAVQPNCSIGRHRVNIGGAVAIRPDGPVELNELPNRLVHV